MHAHATGKSARGKATAARRGGNRSTKAKDAQKRRKLRGTRRSTKKSRFSEVRTKTPTTRITNKRKRR